MKDNIHPQELLLNHLQNEFAEIFTQSSQGAYIYLDDPHWICNERLATLFGYASSHDLHAATASSTFLETLVAPESQQVVADTYWNTVNQKVGATARVTMKKKDGATLPMNVIFVPISYQGTVMALHFMSPA